MMVFKSQAELESILTELWTRIFATPEIVAAVSATPLIAKFRYTDYPTALYIDTKADPPTFYWNPDPPVDADVEMILSSETAHRFWMETLNVPLAIAGRKIIPKGSVPKALKLIPALKPAFTLYPDVLRDAGRPELLSAIKRKKRRKKFKLFGRRRTRTFDESVLPAFPVPDQPVASEDAVPKSEAERRGDPLDLLRVMTTIREFENHLAEAFKGGILPTEAIHLSIGQEAVAAGVCLNLKETDYLNTTHRGHGHIIAKGADLDRIMAEIYGRKGGLCAGKGGPMHITEYARGILGANGIVGAGYLLAMGAGFSIKMAGNRDAVSVVIAGDGSVNQGMFHEALNMIGVFDLPVLVVVENNLYGEFTSLERHSAVTEVHERARAYGIESTKLDGNNATGVFDTVGGLVDAIRQDGRPRLIELMTYRWRGHMEGDSEAYRTEEEKQRYREQDPIARLEKELIEAGTVDTDKIAAVKAEARTAVGNAIAFAEADETPVTEDLFTHVYAPDGDALFSGSMDIPAEARQGRVISVAQAINEAIAQEMERDKSVFLWGEDVTLGGYFSVTEGLVDRFGSDRVIDTPISENGIVGGAVGAALTGMRPVAEILFADFLTCCMDPLINQAAKLRYMTGGQVAVPLTVRTPLGSGIGMAAQHSQSMEKFFFGVPGLILVAPADAYTAKGLLISAIRSNNPVLFLEHKLLYAESGPVPEEPYALPIGKARIVRPGRDVTLVSHLLSVGICLEAAGILESGGIQAEVIDLASLYPLDTKTILHSVANTGYLVTVEEGPLTGGIGAEVVARVATAGNGMLKRPPVRIGAPECPIPYARNLENAMLPKPEAVAKAVEKLLD
jgi:2-oxoisovalerate dehydrogenase E1 component